MSPESGDGIRPPSPESGQPDSGDQSDRNPARPAGFRPSDRIWPDRPVSGHLTGSGQKGRNPAIWPDLAREPVPGRPWPGKSDPGRPWPGRPVPGRLWPGRPDPGRTWPGRPVPGRLAGRIWPDPASLARPGQMAGNRHFVPESGETAGIRPLSPESGYPRFRRNCPDSGLYLEF
jgi:hypothetical protein